MQSSLAMLSRTMLSRTVAKTDQRPQARRPASPGRSPAQAKSKSGAAPRASSAGAAKKRVQSARATALEKATTKSVAKPAAKRAAALTQTATARGTRAARGKPAATASASRTPPVSKGRADKERSLSIYRALVQAHPDAHCELDHTSPFQLVVATVLSAQATDVQVNRVTPGLFAAYPTPEALASAQPPDVEALIGRLGMFRQKAKNIIGLSRALVADHGGQVPRSLALLVALPGVGRKTANVVLGVAFQTPEGVVVDTHVQRLSQRLGMSAESAPEKVEQDLMALLPRDEWDRVSHTLIFHGRRVCTAIKPACPSCPINQLCPSAFRAEHVGRKPPRVRS